MGQPIDSLCTGPGYQDLPPDLARYVAIERMLPDIKMQSSNYGTAVARCIGGDLHRNDIGLESKELCQEVYAESGCTDTERSR